MTTDTETHDAWSTDQSSGFLNDFDGTITDAYFGTSPTYNNGTSLLLHMVVQVDERHQEGFEEIEEVTQQYPVGSNWITEDGGRTAQHMSGNANKRFHATSLYGKILDEITGATKGYGNATMADGGGAVVTAMTDASDVLRGRGMPTLAEVWKGLRFRFAEVVFDYGVNRQTQEKMVSRRAMPVEFLGVAEEEKAAPVKKAAPTKAAEAKAKAEAKKAELKKAAVQAEDGGETDPARVMLEAVDGVTAEQVQSILEILAEAEEPGTFLDSCLEVEGVLENEALITLLADEESGPWSVKANG